MHGGRLAWAISDNVVFGIVNALILNPLPLPEPRQVTMIESGSISISYPNYRDLRDRSDTFSGIALGRINRMGVGVNGVAQPVWGYEASGNYFETLGGAAVSGTLLRPG